MMNWPGVINKQQQQQQNLPLKIPNEFIVLCSVM